MKNKIKILENDYQLANSAVISLINLARLVRNDELPYPLDEDVKNDLLRKIDELTLFSREIRNDYLDALEEERNGV